VAGSQVDGATNITLDGEPLDLKRDELGELRDAALIPKRDREG